MTLCATTVFAAVAGFLLGWWVTCEKIRSMEENPASRFVRFLYAGRLRMALRHKLLMLSFPAMIMVLGAGAWLGLPTVLRPVEKVVALLGADLNEVPGYVDAKHFFTGLKSDDWIALDEGSWFYMPSLYPAASFSQTMEILQAQDTLIKEIPEVHNVLGKNWSRGIRTRSGTSSDGRNLRHAQASRRMAGRDNRKTDLGRN